MANHTQYEPINVEQYAPGEYTLPPKRNYRIEGNVPKGVRLRCEEDVIVDGSMLDGSSIDTGGKIDVMESVGEGCELRGSFVHTQDVGSRSKITATDGNIKMGALGSQVYLTARRGNITFSQGVKQIDAVAGGKLKFDTLYEQNKLQAGEIEGGALGRQSRAIATKGDITLRNVGDQCRLQAQGRVIVKGYTAPGTTIKSNVKKVSGHELKRNRSYHYDGDVIIDGDIPSGALVDVTGDLTVCGDIKNGSYVTAGGSLTCETAYATHLSAANISVKVAEHNCDLMTTKGDITIGEGYGYLHIQCKGDLRIHDVKNRVGTQVTCEGINYADQELALKRSKNFKMKRMGLKIERDKTAGLYYIPKELFDEKVHPDFISKLGRLQEAGAQFSTMAVSQTGRLEQPGMVIHCNPQVKDGSNEIAPEDVKSRKMLDELIRRELRGYVAKYGGKGPSNERPR